MRLLVLGDSLAFHGPAGPEPVHAPGLWPNVAASALGGSSDLVARPGWTARDAWWAVTRDPVVWSRLVPGCDVLVLAVGGMDALPASLPSHWREGIACLRPDSVRRGARGAYRRLHPLVVRATGGRRRCLPQAETDRHLSQVVRGVRYFRPGLPVVVLTPAPWRSPEHPVHRWHPRSVAATHAWAGREGVAVVDVEDAVEGMHRDGRGNPDGLHWDWRTHAEVAALVVTVARAAAGGR